MEVRKLDFVGIPSRDADRARAFYGETLGLRRDANAEYEFWVGDTCLGIWEPERLGMSFEPQRNAHLALHVDDVDEGTHGARGQEASSSRGTRSTPGSATWPSSAISTATISCSTTATRRSEQGRPARALRGAAAPVDEGRALALHRPVGLRSDAFDREAGGTGARPDSMLRARHGGHGVRQRGGDRDRGGARRGHVRAARRPRAARHPRRHRRQVHRPERGPLEARVCSCTCPKGVELEKPLYVRFTSSAPGGASFWRLLVVAEEGSRFSLIEEDVSESPGLSAYTNVAVELFVGQAAKLEYVSIQNLSFETWHFASHRARVDRDAELDWVAGGFGSKKGKMRIENDLAGPGATSRVTGAYFADGSQHLDYDTFQEHAAPHTTSDFAFKGALRDSATAVWRGMIRVEPDAQKTNAYQENRNLILSQQAHADSIPGLEILANDVRCTHGATSSPVNRDELFYCMARGLSRAEAERLIVRGFFQDVLDRIELAPVREAVAHALDSRIPEA